LLSDLDRPGAGFLSAKLPSSATAARAISDFRAEEQARSKLAQRAKKEAEAGMASTSDAASMTQPKPSGPPLPQQVFQNEAAARYEGGGRCRYRLRRAAGMVLVEPLLHFSR